MSATQGRWSTATTAPGGVFVIHAVLLPTGNVLLFSGHVELADYPTESWVWDPKRPAGSAVKVPFPPGTDIFCCHHVLLEDGRVLTAGGAAAHPNHGTGIKAICVFDTNTASWQKIGDMTEARWYPTLVTLQDGRILAFSGRQDIATFGAKPIADSVELFEPPFRGPSYTTKTVSGGQKILAIYPSLHLVKGGKILYTGTTWRYEFSASTPINTFSFRMTGQTAGIWTDEGIQPAVNLREEGTAILLPPAQDGKIFLLGGARADGINAGTGLGQADGFQRLAPGSNARSAEILDTQSSPPAWSPAASGQMNFARINLSAVLLPDGTVFIIGGHNSHKWAPSNAPSVPRAAGEPANFPDPHHPNHTTPRFSGRSTFSLTPEVFDPVANTFTSMAAMHEPRTYHSACLLLPDGRVLCAGGVNPDATETNMLGGTMPLNQKTLEFFEPTYFFKGNRPTITRILSQDGPNIRYDGEFFIDTPDADKIISVVLMRPGAMTHHTDTEQRFVPLVFTKEGGRLKVRVLNDPTVAPPGFYMVWIVDSNKLPCQAAKFVRLSQRQVKPKLTRCQFPRREVETLVAGGGAARFDNVLEVEVHGFLPDELSITTATPTPVQLMAIAPAIKFTRSDGTPVPGLAASPQAMRLQDNTLPAGTRQQVTFPYSVEFDGVKAFFEAGAEAIANQVIRLTASKGDFTGEDQMTLFDDFFQRVIITLRRTTGDQFVSTKEIQLIDTCDGREETDTSVFVSGIPGGSVRAKLATMRDQVDVEP